MNTPRNKQHTKHKLIKAFTLIELSIVLVILGLIIGGLMVGKNLIRSSENRAFISQIEKFNVAVNSFKLKYNALPGDLDMATRFGFQGNGDGNGYVSGLAYYAIWNNATDTSIITGNGSPTLYYDSVSGPGTNLREPQFFWKHMQSAGLISDMASFSTPSKSYSGAMPAAKNDGLGIMLVAWGGKHYYRTGITSLDDGFGGPTGPVSTIFSLNYSSYDAAYIYTKLGGTKISTATSTDFFVPDGLISKDRIIPVGLDPVFASRFFLPVSQGAGGANADYCVDTSVTPVFFNVKNSKKLCALMIQADF